MAEGNGTYKWIAGILATAVVAGAIGHASATDRRFQDTVGRREMELMVAELNRRIGVIEDKVERNSSVIQDTRSDVRELLSIAREKK